MTIAFIITAIMLFAFPQTAYAANDQRLLVYDDPAVIHMQDLYLASGRSLPSMSGPFSLDEMKRMLSYIDYSSLDDNTKELYRLVEKEIDHDRFIQAKDDNLVFNAGLHGDIEGFARTYPAFSNSYDRFGIPGYKTPKPIVELEANLDFADHFSMFTNLGIGLVRNPQTKEVIGTNPILSNMILLPPFSTLDVSPNTPTRASMAAGGHGWSVELGRNKMAWGTRHYR